MQYNQYIWSKREWHAVVVDAAAADAVAVDVVEVAVEAMVTELRPITTRMPRQTLFQVGDSNKTPTLPKINNSLSR